MIRVLSFRPAVVLALLTLVGAPAAAQNIGKTTGNIRGVVKDDTGGVLPGVTVTATSPSLVGVRSVVTGADGAYDFPGLAIGPTRSRRTCRVSRPASFRDSSSRPGRRCAPTS